MPPVAIPTCTSVNTNKTKGYGHAFRLGIHAHLRPSHGRLDPMNRAGRRETAPAARLVVRRRSTAAARRAAYDVGGARTETMHTGFEASPRTRARPIMKGSGLLLPKQAD